MSGELLWDAQDDWLDTTAMGALARERGAAGYEELHRWSVEDLDGFWRAMWAAAGLGDPGGPALAHEAMPGAVWFPEARVNYAARLLDGLPDGEVVIARSQTRDEVRLTAAQLREQVARCAAGLRRLGVGRGDRVVAYLPNTPEALVGLLATAALGAVWSSCPPEFGTTGVIDRFAQIAPKVLLACDGYAYGTKRLDRRDAVREIAAALPTLEHVVHVPYLEPGGEDGWTPLLAQVEPLAPAAVPFDHPLYILFSSGTTGLPKPIVHGHGAMLVEHWKVHRLHHDLGPGDRFFWFSTTGWMMWNYLVSALLAGATIVLFDGDPAHPGPEALWALAEELELTYLGVGAPLLTGGMRAGLRPRERFGLSRLRAIGSTGSPLSEDGFRWVRDHVGVPVQSISGGTDVCSAFLGAAPGVPVWSGELSCRMLGADVRAFGPDGEELPPGELGELVLVRPMPSFPVAFWGDEDGSRLRAAYFEDFEGVWRHGDWVTLTERGSAVIHGRSDATLNRGGVRLGTAELYGVVERLPEVADSLVVHLPGGDLGELVLFVVLAGGAELDEDLVRRIRGALRTELSPRHAPDRVEAVPGIPKTLSGKKCEVPVKRILLGEDPARVVNPSSLQDPAALDWFARTVGA
jgi:acetoacetyl-CoA synthetase